MCIEFIKYITKLLNIIYVNVMKQNTQKKYYHNSMKLNNRNNVFKYNFYIFQKIKA